MSAQANDIDWEQALEDLVNNLDEFIEPSDGVVEDGIFGHLKFRAAEGDIFGIPARLFEQRIELDTKIVVVVSESKRAMMDKSLMPKASAIMRAAFRAGQAATSELAIYTYGELFNILKSFRDPNSWNPASQGFCDPFTIFLVDVDPDFSAEFVLALNAATIFTKTFNANQQNPNITLKLVTMSSESIHPLISSLFRRFNMNIRFFNLPVVENNYWPKMVYSADMKKALRNIQDQIRKQGRGRKNTIITFYGEDLMPDEWRGDRFIKNMRHIQVIHPGVLNIIKNVNEDMLVSFPETFEAAFKLEISGNVHIVGSLVRKRRILDRQTGHEVEATLKLSKLERQAQMAAASWFNIDDSFVCFYAPDRYLDSPQFDFPRRMKFACEQIDGFAAAWTDLGNWPDETFDLLNHILHVENGTANDNDLLPGKATEDGIDYYNINTALDQTWKRLQLQGLIGPVYNSYAFGTAIPTGLAGFFHDLSYVTKYIGKAAHAMAIESTTSTVSQLKMHVLAALWVGMKRLVQIDWRNSNENTNQEIWNFVDFGSTAAIARYGTLWSKLGLMEAIWAKHAAGSCPNSTASHIIDGRISASTLARSNWISCRQSISALADRDAIAMPSVDGFFLREFEFEKDNYGDLCKPFMQAYSNQVAIVTKRGSHLKMIDFASGQHLNCTEDVRHLVDWAEIIRQEEDSQVLGFYTTASRDSRGVRTKISDRNWIPVSLWAEWSQTLKVTHQVGTEAFKTQGASGPLLRDRKRNPDEV